MTERIEILIVKYFSNGLSEGETDELLTWVETGNNKKKLNDFISLNYTLELLKAEDYDDSLLWKHIEFARKKSARKPTYWRYAVAASLLLIITITLTLNRNRDDKLVEPVEQTLTDNESIEPGTRRAILTLENGSEVELNNGSTYQNKNANSSGEEIVYNTHTRLDEKLEYNSLTIPRGGEFYLVLSDGTEVWLNSESKLKYPVSFVEGQLREVELIYGEAYFQVSPSTEHSGDSFLIKSGNQNIEVLGTEFNVKNYVDENNSYITLAEGRIAIDNAGRLEELNDPGKQLVFNKLSNNVTVREVNIKVETAWIRGMFSFRNKPLKNIARVLSRWYDVDIVFENKELENVAFKGNLSKNQDLEEILTSIKNTKYINAYEVKNTIIIIK